MGPQGVSSAQGCTGWSWQEGVETPEAAVWATGREGGHGILEGFQSTRVFGSESFKAAAREASHSPAGQR
jgi:hypothetical protein